MLQRFAFKSVKWMKTWLMLLTALTMVSSMAHAKMKRSSDIAAAIDDLQLNPKGKTKASSESTSESPASQFQTKASDAKNDSDKDAGEEPVLSLSEIQREMRLQHAHELLGKHYKHSIVRSGEKVAKINKRIYRWARERLPRKFRSRYQEVAQTVIDESVKNEFDPVFLMSVIQGESSFDPDKRGSVGELGLMQIRPGTGKWIAHKYGIAWKGKKSLKDPITNIKIGAAYLRYLRERYDSQARLYLAAYNMGEKNVERALEHKVWPKDYPIHVMRLYVEFYSAIEQSNERKSPKG